MSRGQQGSVISTAKGVQATDSALANTSFTNSGTSFTNAQGDLNKTQGDINSFGQALGQFKAANPYVQGGQAETAENQQLADTAAGQAESGGEALQSLAARTGQNAGGAIAATEHMKEDNARTLMGDEANATAGRIAAGTGYGEAVLSGTGQQEGMQQGLSNAQTNLGTEQGKVGAEEGGLAQGALDTEEKAAQTPSFLETLEQQGFQLGDDVAKAYASKGCWIAAAVFDEDFFTGVKTNLVRNWLWEKWVDHWYAKPVLALYTKFGERAAKQPWLVRALRPLFELALRKAVNHGN